MVVVHNWIQLVTILITESSHTDSTTIVLFLYLLKPLSLIYAVSGLYMVYGMETTFGTFSISFSFLSMTFRGVIVLFVSQSSKFFV